ncbi:hypothetical protein ACFX1Q_018765 [Malus domestica]
MAKFQRRKRRAQHVWMKVKIEGTLWISCWKFKSIATLVVLPLIEIASIKGTILDMFAGGTDTTYTVPEWAMTRFLRHPRVLKKLQNEIAGIANGKQDIAESDLEKMHYLKAMIKETLRLHPPIPLLAPQISGRC